MNYHSIPEEISLENVISDKSVTPNDIHRFLTKASVHNGLSIIPLPTNLLSDESRELIKNKEHFREGSLDKIFNEMRHKVPNLKNIQERIDSVKTKIIQSDCYLYGVNDSLKCGSNRGKQATKEIIRHIEKYPRTLFLDTDLPYSEIESYFSNIENVVIYKPNFWGNQFDKSQEIGSKYSTNSLAPPHLKSLESPTTDTPEFYARLDEEIQKIDDIDTIKEKLKTVKPIDWDEQFGKVQDQEIYIKIAENTADTVIKRVEKVIAPHLTVKQKKGLKLIPSHEREKIRKAVIKGILEKDWGIRGLESHTRQLIQGYALKYATQNYSKKRDPNAENSGALLHFFQHMKLWFFRFSIGNDVLNRASPTLSGNIKSSGDYKNMR